MNVYQGLRFWPKPQDSNRSGSVCMKAELESGQNHDSDHLPKKIQNQN